MENIQLPHFKNWYVKMPAANIFVAPECMQPIIVGNIFNHPNYKDNTIIMTSCIVESNGKTITTMSGSQYLIEGEPSNDYKEYCFQHNIVIDLNNPISINTSINNINNINN